MILRDRKLNRLSGHDYSWEGWYFVTIDCMKVYSWFGKINVGDGQCPVRTDSNNHNRYGKLSKIINGYKNMVTKEIRNNFGGKSFVWQRSFYDEIIRDKKSLDRIRKYIIGNPENFLKSK